MSQSKSPDFLLILDIDGLRQDVFHQALASGRAPNLAGLLGGPDAHFGVHLNPVSPMPSITFCAQSTIFTGEPPARHGIVGNQFFDRTGSRSQGVPRFYAFDIGDALAVQDAVQTFTGKVGLLGETISQNVTTLYEQAAAAGLTSAVVYHMVSRGAGEWMRPSLVDIARFTKGGDLFGIRAEQYDREMMDKTLYLLRREPAPQVLTVYFMGLDHESHHSGPGVQFDYLTRVIDVQIGRLVAVLQARRLLANCLVLMVSDHGQIQVIPDDRHSLRLSYPFDREMGYLFDALGLDVHDVPGEGPNCNALVASNGGMAHVYLQHRLSVWRDAPRFNEDVLPVALAFWEAHHTGRYAPDLQGALAMVLVRDVQRDGWNSTYQALTPAGERLPVADFLTANPRIQTVDAVPRLNDLAGPNSGDVLLVSNYADGYYFGGATSGVHGGLHPEDSLAVGSFCWPGASPDQLAHLRDLATGLVDDRRRTAGRQYASLSDLLPVMDGIIRPAEPRV